MHFRNSQGHANMSDFDLLVQTAYIQGIFLNITDN